jgi:hypothetical protein
MACPQARHIAAAGLGILVTIWWTAHRLISPETSQARIGRILNAARRDYQWQATHGKWHEPDEQERPMFRFTIRDVL